MTATTAVTFPVLEFLVAFCLALAISRAVLVSLIGQVSVDFKSMPGGLSNLKCLVYVIAWATVPTILVTARAVAWRVTHTLLSRLFGLLELLFELLKFLGQISHLAQVTTTLFPGLLCGMEGLLRLA